MSTKKMERKETAPGQANGAAFIFTDEGGSAVCFSNYLISDSSVGILFNEKHDAPDSPNTYSVCLFVNGDMIACTHDATWEQAMAYVLAVLSAKTAEEAAGRYGELHPRFTADELVRRVRNPNWEAELAAQAAA